MKNKLGIVMALVLSMAVGNSVFAGVKAHDDNQSGSTAASSKMQNTATHKKTKTKKHRKAKHAKTMKSSKTTAPATKK